MDVGRTRLGRSGAGDEATGIGSVLSRRGLLAVLAWAWLSSATGPAVAQVVAPERALTDPRLVAAGQELFRRHCAVCHGWNAEGTVADWATPGADGKMPPPPLDGSAHAWHHPKSGLMLTIRQGTQSIGGNMPAFRGKLNDAQISAIVDYLISLWPEEVYQAWLQRGGYR